MCGAKPPNQLTGRKTAAQHVLGSHMNPARAI